MCGTVTPGYGPVAVGDQYRIIAPAAGGVHNDFPALTSGPHGLLAVWRRGPGHGVSLDAELVAARSVDGGATWSQPEVILPDPDHDQRDPSLTRLRDGRVALTYYRSILTAPGVQDCVLRLSTDGGACWQEPLPVDLGFASWAKVSGLLERHDGGLVAYGYGADTVSGVMSTRAVESTDGGATWSAPAVVAAASAQPFNESAVVELPGGRLVALVRSDEGNGQGPGVGIYRCVSDDGGATWSTPVLALPGWGRPGLLRTTSGALVATLRRLGDRAPVVSTSRDDGVTWTTPTPLHQGDISDIAQSVYQQMTEVAPGVVAVIYCDELTTGGACARFRYLLDGVGVSPLGDVTAGGSWTVVGAPGGWRPYAAQVRYASRIRARDGMAHLTAGVYAAAGGSQAMIAGQPRVVGNPIPAGLRPPHGGYRAQGAIQYGSAAAIVPATVYVTMEGDLTVVPSASGTLLPSTGPDYRDNLGYMVMIPNLSWPLS